MPSSSKCSPEGSTRSTAATSTGPTSRSPADCRYQVAREHPESRVCVGLAEIQRYQRSWADHMDEIRFEVDEFVIGDPHALALGRISGRGLGSGVETTVELAMLYELDADLSVIAVEEFRDHEQARHRLRNLT